MTRLRRASCLVSFRGDGWIWRFEGLLHVLSERVGVDVVYAEERRRRRRRYASVSDSSSPPVCPGYAYSIPCTNFILYWIRLRICVVRINRCSREHRFVQLHLSPALHL
jgi:hypothetical protein